MQKTNEVPGFMGKGSKGPHVVILQSFLAGLSFEPKLVIDGDFGEVTENLVKEFQRTYGGDTIPQPDGCFGKKTRAIAEKIRNFNFETACQSVSGKTIFVDDQHQLGPVEYENTI